jgi:cell division septal protein FtsQ
MEIPAPKQPDNHIKDRILRFKPVIFLRKNLPVFSVIFISFITMLMGVWNVKAYTITDLNGLEIPTNISEVIGKYVDENIKGKNYFSFSSNTYEKDISSKISYIKVANIEKIAPNKLEIFVELYVPKGVALIRDEQCYLLSEEGIVLENLCEEDIANCCRNYASEKSIYLFSSSEIDVSDIENGKEKLFVMDSISKVIKVVNAYGYVIKQISLSNSVLEIVIDQNKLFRFSLGDDLTTQLERYIVVANKIKSDNLDFKSVDFRFERPVLKN